MNKPIISFDDFNNLIAEPSTVMRTDRSIKQGTTMFGRTASPEARAKMAEAKRNKPRSAETRAKIGIAAASRKGSESALAAGKKAAAVRKANGWEASPESRKSCGDKQRGVSKPRTAEHQAALMASRKANNKGWSDEARANHKSACAKRLGVPLLKKMKPCTILDGSLVWPSRKAIIEELGGSIIGKKGYNFRYI